MPSRIVALLLASSVFSGSAAWAFGWRYFWTGAWVGAVVWLVLDAWRAQADEGPAHRRGGTAGEGAGLWGELAERIRKLVRERDQQIRRSEDRLQGFLAAIQASPNGVVLLDKQGRMAWCNQTAAQQFGIDRERDLLRSLLKLVRDPALVA